jgi:hypothetical protein
MMVEERPRCSFRIIAVWVAVGASLLSLGDAAFAASPRIPLPRPRPLVSPKPDPEIQNSACADRVGAIAVIKQLPPITGPGACLADDVVYLISVRGHGGDRIKVSPPAMLRCGMAEALAEWVREVSEAARGFGSTMTGIGIGTSFDCRGRNRDPNARLSQHGLANAVDVVGLQFKASKTLTLTDQTAPMQVRLQLRESGVSSDFCSAREPKLYYPLLGATTRQDSSAPSIGASLS